MTDNPPVRSFMDDPDIQWKFGKPDYTIVNEKYMRERSKNHAADSLEKIVENIVKTWEMETTHKVNIKDWRTIVPEEFHLTVNGRCTFTAQQFTDMGSYNMLLGDSPLYDASKETNDSALLLFKTALPGGFAWEVLEVLAGPPKVVFTWRHWADWTGPYKEVQPSGEKIEMFGTTIATVTDELKIIDIQVFYDSNQLMAKFYGLCRDSKEKKNKALCPFH